MNPEILGQIIKDLRRQNNLTQKALADRLGVTYQAVSKWENAKNIPDISILKQISDEFQVDLNYLLTGKKQTTLLNKRMKLFLLMIPLIILMGLLIIILHKEDFIFQTISTTCKNFNITGSIAYNKDKSSIYISNIEFCGEEDLELYKKIECTLYQKTENTKRIIDTYQGTNITIKDFTENAKFHIDNFETTCKNYQNNLSIEINAITTEEKMTTYEIPLTLENNCIT